MYFYRVENDLAVSALPDLPFETAEPGTPALFLTEREGGPAVFPGAFWEYRKSRMRRLFLFYTT